jgi:sugar phosphate isomerase/epimerase
VPVIRVMIGIGDDGYLATIERVQRQFDALLPLLERYGVTVGVQNHVGRQIANAMGLRHLLGPYDPSAIAAIWDAAHNALAGEEPELALDIVWAHLNMVNLKNAVWRRTNPGAAVAEWQPYWVAGPEGLASWPRVAAELKRRDYRGVVCLTAEYSEEAMVERYIAEDVRFAKGLLGGGTSNE